MTATSHGSGPTASGPAASSLASFAASQARSRVLLLALGSVVAALFALTDRYALKVVPTSSAQAVWFLGFAVLLTLGALLRRRLVVLVGGVAMGVAGLLQVALDGLAINPIPGGTGAAAVFVALSIGAVGLAISWKQAD